MRLSLIALLAAALLLFLAVPAYSQSAVPLIRAVDPISGGIGDAFVVQGDNLDKANVAELFLTDGKNDIKVAITEQSATSIKFKLLPDSKVGHFALMVLTVGKNARYIEQPVKITVESAAKPAT